MKTTKLYIEFQTNFVKGRKTPIITVINRFSNIKLGEIVYDPAWRTYVFEPEPKTKFSEGCQGQMFNFTQSINKMRKEGTNGY